MVAIPKTSQYGAGNVKTKLLAAKRFNLCPSLYGSDNVSVLLLGRYGFDRPGGLDRWKRRFRSTLDLTFSTVHSAKGCEADYVFLMNAIQRKYGFPSMVEDDPVLHIAMPEGDTYPFAEERRLFYVALTRARRMVLIYTLEHRPSQFLAELVADGLLEIRSESTEGQSALACPECKKGIMVERSGRHGKFFGCSRFPACSHTQNTRRK